MTTLRIKRYVVPKSVKLLINEPTYSSTQIKMDLCIESDLLQSSNAIAEQARA